MADIEYVIGAKDHATAPINKVDGALAKLERSTKSVADASVKSMGKIEIGFKSLAVGAGAIAVANVAMKALQATVSGIIGSISGANAAFDKQTEAVKGLEDSLRLSFDAMNDSVGKSVDAMSASLQGATGSLQGIAAAGDEASSALDRQASATGVATGRMDAAATAASGLESAQRRSADAAGSHGSAVARVSESVNAMSARLQSVASDLQALTGVGDEVTLGLMRQASMLGVSADQLDDTARAAIGLSEATGKSLDESLKIVTNSLQGEFGALGEVIPAIRQATTAEEKLAMVQALAAKGMDAKIAASDRLAGMTEKASGAVGDLMESFGALLAPIRLVIASGTKALAESLQSVLAPAVEYVGKIMDNMKPILSAVSDSMEVMVQVGKVAFDIMVTIVKSIGGAVAKVFGVDFATAGSTFETIAASISKIAVDVGNKIIGAMTMVEVVVTNIGPVWEMMKASAELQLVRLSEIVKHVFTSVVPQYLAWFGDNFTNIIRDVFMGAVTIVQNRLQQMGDMVVRMFEFIASGMQGGVGNLMRDLGEIATRNLLEGFEATTESLPDIVGRQITEREQQLQEKIGGIADDLGKQFSDKFNDRMIKLGDGVAGVLQQDIDLKLNANLKDNDKVGAGAGGEPKLQLTEGRLLSRGPAEKRDDYARMIAQNTKEIADGQKATTAAQMAAASELVEIKNAMADAPRIQLSGAM